MDLYTTVYYSSWSLMIIITSWLAVEVKIWSNFLRDIRKTFFNILLSLIFVFISINIIGLVYSITNPNNIYSEMIRIYFPVISLIVLAFMMRIVNNKSLNASSKAKRSIRLAARHVAYKENE